MSWFLLLLSEAIIFLYNSVIKRPVTNYDSLMRTKTDLLSFTLCDLSLHSPFCWDPSSPCMMPCQSPLVQGAENPSCSHPDKLHASQTTQQASYLETQESTIASDPLNNHSESNKSAQTVLQPEQLQGSESSSETLCQSVRHQPKPGASVVVSSPGERAEVTEDTERKDHCGDCGLLLLAVVLTVVSPLIAVGVCMADIVTGECCYVKDSE